jgi:hypothetical protein
MERTLLIARLEAAKRRVRLAQDQVDRQRMVVARLFAHGADILEAENRLSVCKKLHTGYLADMERILVALKSAIDVPEIKLRGSSAPLGRMLASGQSPRRREPLFKVLHEIKAAGQPRRSPAYAGEQSRQLEHTQLIARLDAAKRRVRLAQDQIDRQRMVVATLFASGADTTEAENRLRVCEKLHDRYLADKERILIALNSAIAAPEIDLHRWQAPVGRMPAPEQSPLRREPLRSPAARPFRRALER